jgi:hypothetical protein
MAILAATITTMPDLGSLLTGIAYVSPSQKFLNCPGVQAGPRAFGR